MRIKKGHLVFAVMFGLLLNGEAVHALDDYAVTTTSTETSQVQIFPQERTFTITAYYSPIAGQERYIRGSLAADKRLNGNGTNGADGTPVFPGMIAAPRTIPFGTKMSIPGIGLVSVHDRGGAIVPAGQRGHSFDRLDVWMGYGDEGLNRALNWGKRTVKVVVYGIDESVEENIDLSGISSKGKSTSSSPSPSSSGQSIPVVKQASFGYGDSSEEIKEIKIKLASLKYFDGQINEDFDQDLYEAMVVFQIQKGVVKNSNEFGAGYFGPQTRKTLAMATTSKTSSSTSIIKTAKAEDSKDQYAENVQYAGNGLTFLTSDLEIGDSGQAVIELQTELKKLHLFGLDPTGYYGEITAHAVFKFQQSQGLVGDKESKGAGEFGPITRSKLSALVNSRIETRKTIAAKPEEKDMVAKQ
jgi:peptidoglycan hydrolase-like protein with peptidoglycan-binding domain/3D (Asp-Asp-Asp) domain-containing protein